jgi:Skp family chaperone for outer membrane proteins
MFGAKTITFEELEARRYSLLEGTLAHLGKHWPAMYEELIKASKGRYASDRIGPILVAQIELVIEKVKKDYETRIDRLDRENHRTMKELQEELDKLKKEKKETAIEVKLLTLSNEELQRKMDAQNDLVASQYEQIQNLTGGTSKE